MKSPSSSSPCFDEEYDEDFEIEAAKLPRNVDEFEILKDLASISISDGDISYSEVEMIHRLGKAFGLSEILVSAAMIEVALNSNIKLTTSFN